MNERSIFAAAMEITDPLQRAAYLNQACGEDTSLRQHLEGLLAEHEQLGSFLAQPLASPAFALEDGLLSEGVGTKIGPYNLLQQIGEGGMGVVYMAEQETPVRRKVALKIIKPGIDSAQVVARFEAERQALALMDHANIARVIDASTTASGRPYFVMELVYGVPITRYCDENQLTPRERLELCIPVCRAIQHAHQKGIVHRDIKPSNIMVTLCDDKPMPKVIDFGVAKAIEQRLTDKTLFTQYGAIIGTLEYMSPEQAEFHAADVDTRADVYSLGVLLYELLTGTTPISRDRLKRAPVTELLRLIREEEPPTPSTRISESKETLASISAQRRLEPARLTRELRGDLDWIVMRCLEKDRTRRYESASGLARDIQRYLADEPVEACPPSMRYRVRKFVRRNRGAVLAALAVTGAVLVGSAVAVWQAAAAIRARDAAVKATEIARAGEAETRAVLQFVQEHILAAARPKGRRGGLGPTVPLRAAIQASLPFVETSFKNKPRTEASVRMTLGISFEDLGDPNAAVEQFEAARAIYTRLLGPDHENAIRCMRGLATSYIALGRYEEAVTISRETLSISKAKFGPDDAQTLKSMSNLARAYYEMRQYAEAMRMHEEVFAIQKAKLGPGDRSTLITMTNLANDYSGVNRHAEALLLRQETFALQKANLGSTDLETLMTAHNLGGNYRSLGRYADAFRQDQETLAARTDTLGRDHPDTLTSLWSVAQDLIKLKRGSDAVPFLDECLELAVGKRVHRNFAEVADLRLRHFQEAQDGAGCQTTAELWEKQKRTDVASLYQAAVCRAVTASVLRATEKSPGTIQHANAEADRALSWLRKAVAAGYKDVAKLQYDKDWDMLHDRQDFQKLLAELQESGQEQKN